MRFFLLLSLTSVLAACGANYDTVKVKEYRLTVLDASPAIRTEFRRLVDDFNTHATIRALTYVDGAEQANSAIILTKGLKEITGGKVGLGQWLSQSESDNPMTTSPGSRPQRVVTYSMRLEFDADYFQSRLGDEDPEKRTQKQKLFFHEVGHGLEMDHNEQDKNDVMYPDISGEKDFDQFFLRVRGYMADD